MKIRLLVLATAVAMALLSLTAATASADFALTGAGGSATNPDGSRSTQAGAHPDFTTNVEFSRIEENGQVFADGNVKDIDVTLPPGIVGNPTVVPTCPLAKLQSTGFFSLAQCPIDTQVGVAEPTLDVIGSTFAIPVGIYNIEPPRGAPALFGFNILGVIVTLQPELRGTDYGLDIHTRDVSQSLAVLATRIKLWGVPADPANDDERFAVGSFGAGGNPSGLEPKAFMTAPTECAGPQTTTIRARSWQDPGVWSTQSFSTDFNGDPLEATGCEKLPFSPKVGVELDSNSPDSPSGLSVRLDVPQDGLLDPTSLATAHLKDVKVALPEGITINPGSADGLQACSDAQLGLGDTEPVSCPDASKIGTVRATTPLLAETLEGSVYVRTQASDDPESGDMFRLALVLRNDERGLLIKLPGSVRADSETGQLDTTFLNNPRMPVSKLELRLRPGARAPLATPASCGPKLVQADLSSWGGQAVTRPTSLDVACPGGGGFAPSFVAGNASPIAGASSPLLVRIDRPDGQEHIDGVSLEMAPGMLANLNGVAQCADASAATGNCPAASRVGSATVGAGPGSNPFYLTDQPVYLGGPYKGAPFSLAVVARAIAGPFDLGTVVVRQALRIHPDDAHVTVDSDPLPTILKGVPLRLRSIHVNVDRPGFTRNPTSCDVKQVKASFHSQQGSTAAARSRFQVGACRALGFTPKLGLRLLGKGRTSSGGHPALLATLTQPKGQANVGRAKVTLPRNVVLDSKNAYDPKLLCGYDAALKADCRASTIVGRASLSTPILNRRLSGPVHLVQGIRFGEGGARIRTLPTLLVKLRGEVSINLRSKTNVDSKSRLVSTFQAVPDAPVSKFSLRIDGGRKGILVVTENRSGRIDLCSSRQTAKVDTDGQNGKGVDYAVTVRTPCAKPKPKRLRLERNRRSRGPS